MGDSIVPLIPAHQPPSQTHIILQNVICLPKAEEHCRGTGENSFLQVLPLSSTPAILRGDTEVRGAEVRGPKVCPVTQVPSAALPLTPSWLLGAALQTLPAQWSPLPATDALPGVTPALPVPHCSSAWAPVNPCELHCRPSNEYFAEKLRDAVVDGTPCYQGQASRDLCINGICKVCPARKRTPSAFLLLPSGRLPQAVPVGFPALPVKPFEGLPLPLSKAPPSPPTSRPPSPLAWRLDFPGATREAP